MCSASWIGEKFVPKNCAQIPALANMPSLRFFPQAKWVSSFSGLSEKGLAGRQCLEAAKQ
jgi:hypothetical protein